MGIRELVKPPASDLESYRAPMNYEPAGKTVEIFFYGGEKAPLIFAEYPADELRDGDPQPLHYRCAKAADGIFYLTYISEGTRVAYVLNTVENLAVRAVTDHALKSAFSFGAMGAMGAMDARRAPGGMAFTDDLAGNTVVWSMGSGDTSSFEVSYGRGTVSVSLPRLRGGSAGYTASDFTAVRTGGETYLQNAVVVSPKGTVCVSMLSDFRSVTCVGSIFGNSGDGGVKYRLFGGYGRVTGV
jgi:hypothetical protein